MMANIFSGETVNSLYYSLQSIKTLRPATVKLVPEYVHSNVETL